MFFSTGCLIKEVRPLSVGYTDRCAVYKKQVDCHTRTTPTCFMRAPASPLMWWFVCTQSQVLLQFRCRKLSIRRDRSYFSIWIRWVQIDHIIRARTSLSSLLLTMKVWRVRRQSVKTVPIISTKLKKSFFLEAMKRLSFRRIHSTQIEFRA